MQDTDGTVATPARRTRLRWVAAFLALGLAGVGAAAAATMRGDAGEAAAVGSAEPGPVSARAASAPVISDPPPAPEGPAEPGPAGDPAGAASGYLTAEAFGGLETAFTYLAPDEQRAFATPAGYVAAHADLLGTVTGFEITDVETDSVDPARATVVARVGFEPALDTVMGLVPAEATVTIPVLETDDGWTIELAGTTFEPLLPSDERAAEDAAAFVAASTDCEPPATGYGASLHGQPRLLDELCDAGGEAAIGAVGPLDDPLITQPFLNAYGPEVGIWARVASVTSPAELRLVLAPYGDAWTVIAVLPPDP
jgi:hypothetical protein